MAIATPAFFGLIARKNERTCAYLEQRRARLMSAFRQPGKPAMKRFIGGEDRSQSALLLLQTGS
jgi:hypothetical protein